MKEREKKGKDRVTLPWAVFQLQELLNVSAVVHESLARHLELWQVNWSRTVPPVDGQPFITRLNKTASAADLGLIQHTPYEEQRTEAGVPGVSVCVCACVCVCVCVCLCMCVCCVCCVCVCQPGVNNICGLNNGIL